MKILVSGGAGYIGSMLVPRLLRCSHDVTVLDNFRYGQTPFNSICLYPNFKVVRGDARDPAILLPLIQEMDIFIPLAALVGAPLCNQDRPGAWSINHGAVDQALRFMSLDQKIIIPISNSGYGVGEPGKECTEESPLKPVSLYGQTKVEVEKLVMGRGNAISLRLATVFGMSPRMRTDLLLNTFVWKAVTDGSIVLFEPDFMRNFCHVQDVVSAFLHCIQNFSTMKDQIYNVGDSQANMSKRQLCLRIKRFIPGFEIFEAKEGTDPDKRDYIVSNAKIEATGWKPRVTIDEGINELIKGFSTYSRFSHGNV